MKARDSKRPGNGHGTGWHDRTGPTRRTALVALLAAVTIHCGSSRTQDAAASEAGADAPPPDAARDAGGVPPDDGFTDANDAAPDRGDARDASLDDAGDAAAVAAPRLIAPLSTSTVTARRPTLRWTLDAGASGAHVEICRDRACTEVLLAFDAAGASGAPATDLPTGTVFWRAYGRSGSVTGGVASAVWQFTVGARSAPMDASWGTTPDVNGDGFADLIVGASFADGEAGHVDVFQGGAAGLAPMPTTVLVGPDGAGSSFGNSVASAGDVNGDGYADVIASALNVAGETGRAYVYLGGAGGLATTPIAVLTGPDGPDTFFGQMVGSAGDVNGDGYADVIVGAPGANAMVGRAYIYLGGPAGPASTPASALDRPLADAPQGALGLAVSAGDVNGDGYGDVVVTAPTAASGGRVYVYLGSATGVVAGAPTTLVGPSEPTPEFARAIAVGDVDGDGYADVVATSYGGTSPSGRLTLYRGGAAGTDPTPAAVITGPMSGDGFGLYSIAAAGDVNDDGFADVVVGAAEANSYTGRAYVYLGSASGLGTTPASVLMGADGTNAWFGYAVAAAGDIDGDGVTDVAISAYHALMGSPGRAYVFRGSAAGLSAAPMDTVTGPETGLADFGYSVAFGAVGRRAEGPWLGSQRALGDVCARATAGRAQCRARNAPPHRCDLGVVAIR